MDYLKIDDGSPIVLATPPQKEQSLALHPSPDILISSAPQASASEIPTRPPRRRAAKSARYNLTAAWSPLNDYLGDSSGNDASADEDGNSKQKSNSRDRKIPSWVKRRSIASNDDSDSDEYKYEEEEGDDDAPPNPGPKRKGNETESAGKKRKRFRRSRASSKRGFTKEDMQRLVHFLLVETDWQSAARHVFKEPAMAVVEGRFSACCKEEEDSYNNNKPLFHSTESRNHDQNRVIRLKKLWSEVLGKQILNLYKQ